MAGVYGVGAILSGMALNAHGGTEKEAPTKVIKIEARKFAYTPNQITLNKGEPVILEFTAIDFMHGFTIPDMHIRADLIPGQVVRVNLKPDVAGDFDFLCDNFCGSGHESMGGKIIVQA